MEADVKCSSQKKNDPRLGLNLSVEKSARLNSASVYSPVTELSMNLGDLSTDTGLDETPKRKFAVSSPSYQPPLQKQLNFGSGLTGDSFRDVGSNKPKSNKKSECRSAAYARFKAMPPPFCGFGSSSPATICPPESLEDKENTPPPSAVIRSTNCIHCSSPLVPGKQHPDADDTNSQDSGVCLELTSKSHDSFKFPVAPAPRRNKLSSDDATNSPLKYSPVKGSPTFKGKLRLSIGSPPPTSPSSRKTSPSPSKSSLKHNSSAREPSPVQPRSRSSCTPGEPSPVKLRKSSLTSSPADDPGDEGFLDLKEVEQDEYQSCGISGLDKLISAPVLNASLPKVKPDSIPNAAKPKCVRHLQSQLLLNDSFEIKERPAVTRRGLFRSPSDPLGGFHRSKSFAFGASPSLGGDINCLSPAFCSPLVVAGKKSKSPRCASSKRTEPCAADDDDITPMRHFKRRKSVIGGEPLLESSPSVFSKLHRSHSEAEIKHAISQADSQPDLIGDYSKSYCLPTVPGDHPDLKSISDDTMADLLRGEYDHVVEKYIIVDSRYPYEYSGGHIKGAKNIFTKDDIVTTFLESSEHRDYKVEDESKRQILIFHCEFSKNRGPKLLRFLRNHDRDVNKDCYPVLNYPEMYLLRSGYKDFYHSYESLCEPQAYVPMTDTDHGEDLRKFRAKSKSWAGEQRSRQSLRSGLKF